MSATRRIPFDELPDELQDRLQARVDRLGYLGEFFQLAGHQPVPLAHFIDFTEALRAALPARLTEVIALTIAARSGNDYERVQHERLALRLGMTETEVAAIVGGRPLEESGKFSETECSAAHLAECVASAGGRGCPTAYARLEARDGSALAVGCLMTAARYLAHAAMSNTWALRPPAQVVGHA